MHVRTGSEREAFGEEFNVFRPKRLFFSQSYAGLIYTRRATRGSNIGDRHTVGADFRLASTRFRGSQNVQLSGFVMKTPNPAKNHDNAAWGLKLQFPNDRWLAGLSYKFFDRNVDPALGFIEQADYQKWTPEFTYAPRPKNSRWIRQVSFGSRIELFTNAAGRWTQRNYLLTPLRVDLHSGDNFFIQVEPTYDRLENDFRIRTGARTSITLPGQPISVHALCVAGQHGQSANDFRQRERCRGHVLFGYSPGRVGVAEPAAAPRRSRHDHEYVQSRGACGRELFHKDPARHHQHTIQPVHFHFTKHPVRFGEPPARLANTRSLDCQTGRRSLYRVAEQLDRYGRAPDHARPQRGGKDGLHVQILNLGSRLGALGSGAWALAARAQSL